MASAWDNLPQLAPPLIEGVLRQGHKLLLAGPSKAGKSYALIELCCSIAEGRPWLGFSCAQGRVLYVNLELDRASCLHRFRDVYEALGQPPEHLGSIDVWNLRGRSIPMNMRDMDMVQGREFIRNAVLEHFGVPREIMGITESSNRATSEAAQYIYAQNVIMPRLRKRQDAINLQILPFFGEGLIWRFDDVVPRSQEFDNVKGIDGWNAGLLTKDEARELLGMEPCTEGGDIYKVTISDVFVHGDEDPAEVTSALMGSGGDGMGFDMGMEDDPDDPPDDEITIEDGAKGGPGAQEYKVRPSDVARLKLYFAA